MLVTKIIEIDAGHRLPSYEGKCRFYHGHRYKIEVTIQGTIEKKKTSNEGMVIDFSLLKSILQEVIVERYDHRMIIQEDDFLSRIFSREERKNFGIVRVGFVPTVENLVKYWFELVDEKIKMMNVDFSLYSMKVYETPTSFATYYVIE
jgi:6-pyruvoyltetrahydropterin/6-carboxytetrahydropterin synthase